MRYTLSIVQEAEDDLQKHLFGMRKNRNHWEGVSQITLMMLLKKLLITLISFRSDTGISASFFLKLSLLAFIIEFRQMKF